MRPVGVPREVSEAGVPAKYRSEAENFAGWQGVENFVE